ncbi:MAG TPA: heterodisulfide reductase-related iron-sulfur binding cluster, partial [Acidimicrobiales bacterium]|nr:heterodisulfide reductase-related iron-sulfur binding cluster [Acidimicrobiales bacterium]
MTELATQDEITTRTSRAIKPNQIAVGVGVAFAIVVVASGVAATVNQWHDVKPVQREVFANIPSAWKAVFYTVIPLVILYGGIIFSQRVKNWQRGAPDDRGTTRANVGRRLADFRAGVYMQTLLRDPAAGVMHSLIYFNFLILLAVTTVLEINHQVPEGMKFLHGQTYQAYSLVGDVAGVLFTFGVVWAIVRRYVQRPYRIRTKSKPEHAVILATFLGLGVTGFLTEAMRIALEGRPEYEKWSVLGYPLSGLFDGSSHLQGLHQFWWLVHVLLFVLFLVILPITMLRHMFTSPLNMYLRDRERPKGAMKAMPNLMETELETFGASTVEDFTWKQLLDTDACTMCGRCTSVCPAHATGKPLDPREIVLKTGEVMAATGNPVVSPPIGVDPEITVSADSLFERITPEEVWACTSCKACDEICPVNIEILDKILDMRRYLSLMESNFPTELGTAYRSMENSGNPWGLSQSDRAAWAAKVPGVPIVEPGDSFDHEFLYWVGCAGSFDDKNQKVSVAMAKLMQRAGIDFAILGPSENCTGDPARRSGNEYIYQMLAMQNIESLNGMGVRKIVTQCPHCFNTLSNEYPQLGGNYEVVHHSQFLEWLISEG